ncbi:MAG: hypothetical protein QXT25_01180 [Candidatus Anstonellaceae archaeon]
MRRAVVFLAAAAIAALIIFFAKEKPAETPHQVPFSKQQEAGKQLAQECQEGQVRNCTKDGCNGTQKCYRGRWGICVLPRKICNPKERIGCSYDGCRFGYSECNECGTGFGPCILPQDEKCR